MINEGRLTVSEKGELRKLETTIEKGMQSFFEVGSALMKIRDSRLYRDQWKTFEAYCEDRFDLSRRRAYQLIESVKTVERVDLCTSGTQKSVSDIIPTERAARAIAQVPEQELQEVLDEVVEQHKTTGEPVTAKTIKEAAKKVADKKPEATKSEQIELNRKAAIQHSKQLIWLVDAMNGLKRDRDNHSKLHAAWVTVCDTLREGWK
jgi:hypothetical protein